jgi:ADP-ribose pyrophosphatase YjhB (NUDIX family)
MARSRRFATSIGGVPEPEARQRVAAYGLARRDTEVLMVQASSKSGVRGTWWLPGGGVEFGERPAECLVREFLEETGLRAHVRCVRDVVSDVTVMVEEPVRLHSVRLIYEVDVDDGPLRPEVDGSTDAVRWVHLREMQELPLIPWLKDLDITS